MKQPGNSGVTSVRLAKVREHLEAVVLSRDSVDLQQMYKAMWELLEWAESIEQQVPARISARCRIP
jgi:hypothetical protein